MPTTAEARALFLGLPHAVEASHHGTPDFRVGGRIFATLPPGTGRAYLKTSREAMTALAASDPATFAARPWGASSGVLVALDRVDPAELEELAVEAWLRAAPKRLHADLGERAPTRG